MKKTIAFMLAAAILLSVTGCRMPHSEVVPTDSQPMKVEMGQTESDYEGVEVQITDAAWGEDGLVLKVDWINRTPHEALFGASYSIERKEGDRWVNCQAVDELVFIAIAYILPAGDTRTETYQVSALFDVSEAGTYRFRSQISVDDGTEKADQCDVWATFTLGSDQDESQIKTQEPMDYGVQYVRTDGYLEGALFPKVVIIRSPEELNDYYEEWKGVFSLGRREKVYSDSTKGFLDVCDKYDAAYFEKGFLVFVLLEEGSGSIRHEVTGSTISSDGNLGIYIKRIVPEVGTCDMAQWHIILEMSKAAEVKDENSVQVYVDSELRFDEGAAIVQIQAPVIYTEPPKAELLHGNGSAPLRAAGFSWMYPNGDGTMAAVMTDHAHPLDCQNILDPIYVSGEYIKLDFEDAPDSIEVVCWPDTAWNDSSAISEPVSCYDNAFTLNKGGYIYEITARWDESETEHFGSVSYYAYIVCE